MAYRWMDLAAFQLDPMAVLAITVWKKKKKAFWMFVSGILLSLIKESHLTVILKRWLVVIVNHFKEVTCLN